MEDEIERLVSENVKRAEDQFSQVPLIVPSFISWSKMRFQKQKLMKQSLVRLKPAFNLFEELENQIMVQEVDKSKKAVKKNREDEKKKNEV